MRMPRLVVWLSVLDFLVVITLWGWRTLHPVSTAHSGVDPTYWTASALGLVLAVYGFVVLVRGGSSQLSRSVTCVLFALAPACAALIGLLSRIGPRLV